MTIDTQYLDADGDKIKLARPALLDMAQRINNLQAFSVTSIANLRLIDKTKASRAIVLGYYTAGDGGGGVYWHDSTDTTTADNGGTAIVATDGARWKLQHAGAVTIKQFGCKMDGTDDHTTFQAAITAAQSQAFRLVVPMGTATVSAALQITSAVCIEGLGRHQSIVKTSSGTANVFTIATGTNTITGIAIRNLYIDATAVKTGGWAIEQTVSAGGALYWLRIEDIKTSNEMYGGIYIRAAYFTRLTDVNVEKIQANQAGIRLAGLDAVSGSKVANIWISRCSASDGVAGVQTTGLYIDSYVEGVYCSDSLFESSGLDYGVYIRNTLAATRPPENMFFTNVVCDNQAKTGLLIDNVYSAHFTQCWFCSAVSGFGVWVAACQDVQISNGFVIGNGQEGIRIDALTKQVRIQGNAIDVNGQLASNTYDGIGVLANTTDFIITGNDFYRAGSTKRQRRSVTVYGGTSDRYVISHNNMNGYISAAISDGGSGVNKVVGSNIT